MILILSKDFDLTTDSVIDWLKYYGAKYMRINNHSLSTSDILYALNLDVIKAQKDVLWIRKINSPSSNPFLYHLHQESLKGLYEIADWSFKKVIGNFNQIHSSNKLKNLKLAQAIGLKIPPTLVTTSKEELIKFISQQGEVITKCTSDMIPVVFNEKRYYQYTTVVNGKLSKLPDKFCVSLFQKHIKKIFDVKVFFFNDSFYGQAIFSQSLSQTSVDFRKYNDESPNRITPFNLPTHLKNKISLFMKNINETMGTVDFIMSEDNQLYFLEINPNGEFSNLSKQGNYNILRQGLFFKVTCQICFHVFL